MVVLALAAPVVVLAACFGLGRAALRLAGLKVPRGEGAFYSVAAGLGLLSLVMFGVGIAGWIYRPVVLGLAAVGIVVFARDWVWCAGRLWRTIKRFLVPVGTFNRLLLAAILVVIALDLVSALAPPSETDALTLHLFAPREYIGAHSMIYLPDNWDQAMAMGPHLVYAVVMLMSPAGAADAAPGVLHFLVGSVFVLWVWQFARRRIGASAAYAAAAVLACTPMMTHLISAPMVVAFFALYAFASVAALLEFLQKRRLQTAVAAGVFAGFAAGAKFSGLAVIAACCISASAGILVTKPGRLRGLWPAEDGLGGWKDGVSRPGPVAYVKRRGDGNRRQADKNGGR
ncbi:MAG: glycosyltransferase family 39 protein [Planctomycetes bacterium]|nr:glycosyltransferase family 39 protein [Planctomycetota bacterium]